MLYEKNLCNIISSFAFYKSFVEVIYSVFMLGICLIRYTGTITVTNEFVVIVIIGGVLITTTDRFLYKRKKLICIR